jgi:hypothetical protein
MAAWVAAPTSSKFDLLRGDGGHPRTAALVGEQASRGTHVEQLDASFDDDVEGVGEVELVDQGVGEASTPRLTEAGHSSPDERELGETSSFV